jgi:hypothetical protein
MRRVCGRVRRLCAAAGSLAVLLLACESPAPAAAVGSVLIVPGQSIGPARIGMSVTELTEALGPADASGSDAWLSFPHSGIAALVADGVAVQLSTTSPRFRTASGAGVGTPRGDAPGLVGDRNEAVTRVGDSEKVLYPFQGIGFVFRRGRAVEVFVVARVALGPPAAPVVASAPQAPETRTPSAPGPSREPLRPAPPAPAPPGASPARGGGQEAVALALRDLSEVVDAEAGMLRVTGKLVTAGAQPARPVTVTVTFHEASGAEVQQQAAFQQPLAPGAEAAFSTQASIGNDLIARYTVAGAVDAPGGPARVEETRTVPPAAYAEFARRRIRVKVDLGGPTSTGGLVQVLVSIGDTRPIPRAWVKDVTVEVPAAQGAQVVHVAPERPQTILVPPLPAGGPGFVSAPVAPGEQPPALQASVVGQPKVTAVTLGAP